MEIGLVGKPNVGKSTFFSAVTLAKAEIASYPFTTIEANKGMTYVKAKCPHVEFNIKCTPHNSKCEDGVRFLPVEAIDVAGLVEGAHKGRGLGNKFLDDLRQASALIHIIDASGSTDLEGQPCEIGAHDPIEDVDFLEKEIAYWLKGIITKGWQKLSRQAELEGIKIDKALHERLTGLGISESEIYAALRKANLSDKPSRWSEEDLLDLSTKIREIGKPIIIAANKCDKAPKENIEKLQELEKKGYIVIPTSAEFELALRRASKAGLIDYKIGEKGFKIVDESKLNSKQLKALEKMQQFFEEFESTGIQNCVEEAVFNLLDLIVVYPVEDEHKLTDKNGRVLPDAYLMKKGCNAKDLAYKVHTDLGDKFIRAIDVRSQRVVGAHHELNDGDIIKIAANA